MTASSRHRMVRSSARSMCRMIHVPTMLEVSGANITTRPDGDAPGDQYRVYEFPGMGHVDTRNNVRLHAESLRDIRLSTYPMQAYMSVALNYLFQWVDKGIAPPKADRILKDGTAMAWTSAEIRRAESEVRMSMFPVTKYGVPNKAASPLPAKASDYVTKGGQRPRTQMCGLSAFQNDFSKEELKQFYGSKKAYRSKVEKRVSELEKAGWSLPVYREMILGDAAKVEF